MMVNIGSSIASSLLSVAGRGLACKELKVPAFDSKREGIIRETKSFCSEVNPFLGKDAHKLLSGFSLMLCERESFSKTLDFSRFLCFKVAIDNFIMSETNYGVIRDIAIYEKMHTADTEKLIFARRVGVEGVTDYAKRQDRLEFFESYEKYVQTRYQNKNIELFDGNLSRSMNEFVLSSGVDLLLKSKELLDNGYISKGRDFDDLRFSTAGIVCVQSLLKDGCLNSSIKALSERLCFYMDKFNKSKNENGTKDLCAHFIKTYSKWAREFDGDGGFFL